jgi:hypothetical protein
VTSNIQFLWVHPRPQLHAKMPRAVPEVQMRVVGQLYHGLSPPEAKWVTRIIIRVCGGGGHAACMRPTETAHASCLFALWSSGLQNQPMPRIYSRYVLCACERQPMPCFLSAEFSCAHFPPSLARAGVRIENGPQGERVRVSEYIRLGLQPHHQEAGHIGCRVRYGMPEDTSACLDVIHVPFHHMCTYSMGRYSVVRVLQMTPFCSPVD